MEIATRQEYLMVIESSMKSLGKKRITNRELMLELKKKTGVTISEPTISRDLVEIHANNSFVKDIAIKNYSKMVELSTLAYLRIEQESWDNYYKEWNANKTIHKMIDTPNGETEITETIKYTQQIAQAKATFLRIALDARKALDELRDGKACDLSVVLLGDKYRQMETENNNMKHRLEAMASE